MAIFTTSREATKDEMAREIDRCHKVIAELEAALADRARVPDVTDFDAVLDEAGRRFREWSGGVRGQVMRREDGIDYWIWRVMAERARVPDREAGLREAAYVVGGLHVGGGRWVKVKDAERAILSLIGCEPILDAAAIAAMQETKP